jgi:hypothetical protein
MRVGVAVALLMLVTCAALGVTIAPASVGAKSVLALLDHLRQGPQLAISHAPTRLACVQPPNACTSNSDCTCSNCCAQLGEGGPQVCQPTC